MLLLEWANDKIRWIPMFLDLEHIKNDQELEKVLKLQLLQNLHQWSQAKFQDQELIDPKVRIQVLLQLLPLSQSHQSQMVSLVLEHTQLKAKIQVSPQCSHQSQSLKKHLKFLDLENIKLKPNLRQKDLCLEQNLEIN